MMYIAIMIITLMGGLIIILLPDDYNYIAPIGIIAFFYGFIALMILIPHNNASDDMDKYNKARYEAVLLQSTENMPMEVVMDYLHDINEANELIGKSSHYHNHWYLSPFYYEEIGKLEPIVLDSIRIYFKQPMQSDEVKE